MISLTSATKRAEEFAAAVDGRTAQDDLRAELAELVDLVGSLRATPIPEPRTDFVADLRERLLAEAETALSRDAALALPPRRKGRERRLAIAASAFVLVGGTAGMAAAAQDALPGDALYPIKRGIETAQADLTGSQDSKGQHLLDQADSRLAEVQGLLAEDASSTQVSATLDSFVDQANEGADLLLGPSEDQQDPETVTQVRDFTAQAMETLGALSSLAPAGLQDEFADAAGALQQIDDRATAACASCADARPPLSLAPAFTGAAEAQRALQALSRAQVDNDHPTIGGIPQPDNQGGKGTQDNGGSGSTGAGDDSSGATDGGDGVLSGLGDTVAGLTGGGSSGSTSGGGTGGGNLLDDVTDPVKDTVKDVTPDPVDDTLDSLLP